MGIQYRPADMNSRDSDENFMNKLSKKCFSLKFQGILGASCQKSKSHCVLARGQEPGISVVYGRTSRWLAPEVLAADAKSSSLLSSVGYGLGSTYSMKVKHPLY